MNTPTLLLRAAPASLATALVMLTGCAHTATRESTQEWSTESIVGVIDDAEVQIPVALRQDQPEYPLYSRRTGITGIVHVDCLVDETGRVAQVAARSDTNHELTASALQAVKKWSFSPGSRNGVPVPMRVSVPVIFKLEDE